MQQRIAAGALVFKNNKILMVNHRKAGAYDFWVAPGGGVIATETLEDAVCREAFEETNLIVKPIRLMYIEEFYQPTQREVKFWYLCQYLRGEIDCSAEEASREYIVDARFLAREELKDKITFPSVIQEPVWQDINNQQHAPRYLGLRKMEFY